MPVMYKNLGYSESESCSVVSNSLRPHGLQSPWNSPGQTTGVGSLSLLQWIFLTQELNRGLLHYRRILYQLSHQGSSRILQWVAYPFSSGSSQPRNWTGVSCIAGGFFTSWATREAPCHTALYRYTKAQPVVEVGCTGQSTPDTWTYMTGHRNTYSHLWKVTTWRFI